MKAAIFRRFGGPEVLEWSEVDDPSPGPGELLVHVHASSVNPVDCAIRSGAFRMLSGRDFPMVAGHDLAGEVVDVGEGVTRFAAGDRVFGMREVFGGGAQGEYAVVAEDGTAGLSDETTFETAGVVPLAALTAWQALHELGHIGRASRVLVNGASGGVGTFAVQLARLTGAEVVGVCSTDNVELVRRLGAHDVVDYTSDDPTERSGFDIVFDTVCKLPFTACTKMLRAGGTWICTRFSPAYLWARIWTPLRRRRVRLVMVRPDAAQLARLAAMLTADELEAVIHGRYPITELPAAHAESETGHACGKIAVSLTDA